MSYQNSYDPNHIICAGTGASGQAIQFLCDSAVGCCGNACCPKDKLWMGGVYVLIAFVVVIVVCGAIALIFCMQRSRSKDKQMKNYYAESGQYPTGRPVNSAGSVISQPAGSTGYLFEPLRGEKY